MAMYRELREAYINGTNLVMPLMGVLSRDLLLSLSNAWFQIRELADQACYDEWVAANPEAVKLLETSVAEYEEAYRNCFDEEWAVDDYYEAHPSPQDYGYQSPDWPDFGI